MCNKDEVDRADDYFRGYPQSDADGRVNFDFSTEPLYKDYGTPDTLLSADNVVGGDVKCDLAGAGGGGPDGPAPGMMP